MCSLSDWIVTAVHTEPGYDAAELAQATVGQPAEFRESGSDARVLQLEAAGYPQRIRYTTTLEGVRYKREMRCARTGDAIVVTHYELSARSA